MSAIQQALLMHGGDSDPYWSDVLLLIQPTGTDGSTSITDDSSFGRTVTVTGNAQIDTAQGGLSGCRVLFDDLTDRISVPDSTDFDFNSNDWFMEARIRFAGYAALVNGSYQAIVMGKDVAASRGWHWTIVGTVSSYTTFRFVGRFNGVVRVYDTSQSFSLDTDYTIAVGRSGNSLLFFLDGALIATHTTNVTGTLTNNSSALWVGGLNYAGSAEYTMDGWIEQARITANVCRQTGNYTIATGPFPTS